MKKIKLSRGMHTIVNNEDFKKFGGYRWYCSTLGYAVRKIQTNPRPKRKWKMIWLHREIMDTPLDLVTDHINGNTLDNRKANLRVCNQSVNSVNRHVTKAKSGKHGVHWDEKNKKWRAIIQFNGKKYDLGRYKDLEEADSTVRLKRNELFEATGQEK